MDINKITDSKTFTSENEIVKNLQKKAEKTPASEKEKEFKLSINSREEKEIEDEINKINELAENYNIKRNLQFSVKDKQIVIKVMDGDDNIIREIPPEKILEFRSKFREVLGLFIDREL